MRGHRISRPLSNLLDLYTFLRRALNRAKYKINTGTLQNREQILRRIDDRSRRGSEGGKNSKRARQKI